MTLATRSFGYLPDPVNLTPSFKASLFALHSGSSGVPDSYDLLELCEPVQQQGSESSCTGQMAKCLCDLARKAAPDFKPFAPFSPSSALFPYANGRALEWGDAAVEADLGAFIHRVMESLVTIGNVPFMQWGTGIDWVSMGYVVEECGMCVGKAATDRPDFFLYEDAFSHRIKYDEWLRIFDTGEDRLREIERIVWQKHGVGFGGPVSKSYENLGRDIIDPADGEIAGNHAQTIVGYNRPAGLFLVRNSWGEDWGGNYHVMVGSAPKGYAWVPYDYFVRPEVRDFSTVLRYSA